MSSKSKCGKSEKGASFNTKRVHVYLPCPDFGVRLSTVVPVTVGAVEGAMAQGYDPRAPGPVIIGLLQVSLQPVALFCDVLTV